MVLYLTIIIIANIIVSALNIAFGTAYFGYEWWFVVIMCVVSTAFQFAADGLFAFIINKMPNKWFAVDNKHFEVSKRCQQFYQKLGIRKWKDKVWELGGLGGFRKNKINDPNNPEYIEQFIIESNKGIVTHRVGYFVGFLCVFIFPLKYALVIGLPIALVNLFLNILPTMVLRYNLPKLHAVLKRLKKYEKPEEPQNKTENN